MEGEKKYKGVRRRSWGKWVSEVRVPSSRERLWLGSYSTPEAAAVARDTAVFLLRGPSSSNSLNFPNCVSPVAWAGCGAMSPRWVQKVASDSGMAVDARLIEQMPRPERQPPQPQQPSPVPEFHGGFVWEDEEEYGSYGLGQGEVLDISIDDMEICF